MRTRIALTTTVAVALIPVVLVTIFTSSPAASVRTTVRHEASANHRTTLGDTKLRSYVQAQKVANLATFYNAVLAHQQAAYYKAVIANEQTAYLEALAASQQAAFYRAVEQRQQEQAALAAAAAATGGSDATSTNTPDWACIRQHESSGNYSVSGGGAYQFELGTWEGLTGLTSPAQDYPPAVQDAAALKLHSERGWGPWTTRYVCGL